MITEFNEYKSTTYYKLEDFYDKDKFLLPLKQRRGFYDNDRSPYKMLPEIQKEYDEYRYNLLDKLNKTFLNKYVAFRDTFENNYEATIRGFVQRITVNKDDHHRIFVNFVMDDKFHFIDDKDMIKVSDAPKITITKDDPYGEEWDD